MKKTEYDNIDIIGETCEHFKNNTEKILLKYYQTQDEHTVSQLFEKMKLKNFEQVIDLGCSIGVWYNFYRQQKFKKIIGIDISKERAEIAKKRGFNEIHICNAYNLPFNDSSQNCIISNNVILHVLDDLDRLKILHEIKRVLKQNGIFIYSFANATGYGYNTDTTLEYEKFNLVKTMNKLVQDSGLVLEYVLPSYYLLPKKGAHPKLAKLFTSLLFPLTDSIFKKINNLKHARIIYFGVRKK